MKILLYGFKSYKGWKKNISQSILRKVRRRPNTKKVVFPIRYEKNVFLEKIRKYDPDVILGVGQYRKGRKFRLERKARNIKKVNRKSVPKMIVKKGAEFKVLNVELSKTSDSWVSYNAGTDISNFSMYLITSNFPGKKFAFINIPKKCDQKQAAWFVEDKIDELERKLKEKVKQKPLSKYF